MGNENMAEQIDDLLEETPSIEGDDLGTDEPTTDEVVDDAAGEDTIADAVEGADTNITTEEPSATEDAQAGGEPAAGVSDEDTPFVESIDEIRARIAEMSTPAPIAAPAEGDVIIDPLDAFKDDLPYITEENLAQIADDPLLLNAAMNNVRRQTAENLLSIVPQLIQKAIQENTVRTETHNAFYAAHKELVPYKTYVSSVAKDIQAKNPDKTQEEILGLVATSVKASLKIAPQKAATKDKKPGGKPALRNAGGGGRANKATAPKSDMAAQIADLL